MDHKKAIWKTNPLWWKQSIAAKEREGSDRYPAYSDLIEVQCSRNDFEISASWRVSWLSDNNNKLSTIAIFISSNTSDIFISVISGENQSWDKRFWRQFLAFLGYYPKHRARV